MTGRGFVGLEERAREGWEEGGASLLVSFAARAEARREAEVVG